MLAELLAITLFGYVWIFWTVFSVFLLVCFLAEKEEQGVFSFVALVVFSVLLAWKGVGYDTTFINDYLSWGNLFVYLSLGFVYSLVRIYLLARSYSDGEKKVKKSEVSLVVSVAKENFLRWILQFPISLIAFTFTDVFKYIGKKISSLCSGLIESVVKLGLKHGVNDEDSL